MKKKIKHSRRSRTGQVTGEYDGEVNNQDLPHGKGKTGFYMKVHGLTVKEKVKEK